MLFPKTNSSIRPAAKLRVEIGIVIAVCAVTYFVSSRFDLLEALADFAKNHERLEIDEFIVVSMALTLCLAWMLVRRWRSACAMASKLESKNWELRQHLDEITRLRSMIPLCAWCRKVRDDDGYWRQVENYVAEHANLTFTHGLCPDCAEKMLDEAEREL